MAAKREFDIVLFGATGFTGTLTAEYLARHGGPTLRWALAGRSLDKLQKVRERLAAFAPGCSGIKLLLADVADPASIQHVAESARVVITTVGPYIHYGEPLVAACAKAGTDYVDLTGEPEFVDLMWLRYHELAAKSGARIVHCCGFDSIPHDLGVWFTVGQLPANVPIKIEGFVRAGGTFSGGTLHSAVTAFSRFRSSLNLSKQRRQAQPLPAGRKIGSTGESVHFEKELDGWAVPMPTIDPQIVRRSAAALDRYGPDFRYGHFLLLKKLTSVAMLMGGVAAVFAGAQFRLTRDRLLRIRQAGDGPSPEQRSKGWFKVTFIGTGGAKKIVTQVSGGDPGYGETAKMLAESALCLAFDKLPRVGGVLTPAQAMGNALLERLQLAGIRFEVLNR